MTVPFVREFFLSLARQLPLSSVVERWRHNERTEIGGLPPSAQLLVTVLLHRLARRPVILIVPDNRTAEEWRETLASFQELTASREEEAPLVLPAYETDPYEGLAPHPEIREQRALALWRAGQEHPILIVPIVAAATRLAPPAEYRALTRTIRRGDFIDLEGLAEQLTLLGYERSEPVEMPGQFSIRGGLLDLFSPEAERPVRLELFGDEVESLREFDPETQRSVQSVEHAAILPLAELPATAERVARVAAHIRAAQPSAESNREPGEAGEDAANPVLPPGWEFLTPEAEGFSHSIFDLADKAAVLVAEPELAQAQLARWWRRLRERHAQWQQRRARDEEGVPPLAPAPEAIFAAWEEVASGIAARAGADFRELHVEQIDLGAESLELAQKPREWRERNLPGQGNEGGEAEASGSLAAERFRAPHTLAIPARPSPRYQGAIPRLMDELREQVATGMRVVLLAGNMGEVERLADLFQEYKLPYQLGARRDGGSDFLAEKSYLAGEASGNLVVTGNLLRGFVLPGARVMLFGYGDLFQGDETLPAFAGRPRRKSKISTFLSDFRDLAIGDYVVHVEHGIGQYVGLKTLDGESVAAPARGAREGQDGMPAGLTGAEFMVIEYAEQAKLYVPLTRMDLVQKFRSAEGARPVLDRLGGTGWQSRKTRVKKAMKDMADELLKLYAERQAVHMEPCGPDGPWQREFDDSFPYTETEDQARAIEDVRGDLRKPRPMDRLVVGDVGYGKTEVAMRAAFKLVSEGRQVAVLAPTTVLAFQHTETFRNRFRAFPISIDMLSRFRTPAQQRETLDKLKHGKLDIVVGTHRLLSKDVEFQNLGLLIIDEEQRFGVRHKERLKQMKKQVHVLAMSATPIPRTLNMSLAGLRDMSVIETPPKDRLAIQTVVAPFNEEVIGAAIDNELSRGGQIYFVHNRVDTIWDIAGMLQRLAPEARIAVGHGQMEERELERVMMRFVRHEADILVSTTIIENGLDIPLANTMVVNRADHLGLSELYQLRGRVGRSNRRAYAFLLVPPETELTPIARKRLAAMREFSDLGAGFKIAALDLELRGGGNLLGGEQSGHVDAVGFDLYVKMLEQTVKELKGEEVMPEMEIQIHLGLDIRIPPDYIVEENQRLRMYKRLAEAESEQQRQDVSKELEDRYGPLPLPVRNLLAYSALKGRCRAVGIQALERKRDQLQVRFAEHAKVEPQRLAEIVERTAGAQFTPQGILKLPFAVSGAAPALQAIDALLEALTPTVV